MSSTSTNHSSWIRRCLELARRGAGFVSPNPLVGCVIVASDGTTLGEGWHERYGEAHGEVNAITAARRAHGDDALERATLYVNLEPCAHFGKTPPCTDLIVETGIPSVVLGMQDPFFKVNGRGIERLREAGVEVIVGVEEAACRRLNEAYLHHLRTGRPLVSLKMAQTLDGCVATATGDSRWVSSEASRLLVHRWRSESDAVLVGAGTAAADDPSLTVRHVEGPQPIRIVLDRAGTLPSNLKLFTDRNAARTLAVVASGVNPSYEQGLRERGGAVLAVESRDQHLDLAAVLDALGRPGLSGPLPIQSILVEAGPGLATALFAADLVDRFFLFIAPKLVGSGLPSLGELEITKMNQALEFDNSSWERIGDDILFSGWRRSAPTL